MVRVTDEIVSELQARAQQIRRDIIEMTYVAKAGHPGGSLSIADMVAALYFHVLRLDPTNPAWPERDRFILSKGHTCPALYAALARRGFFDAHHLNTLRRTGTILQGHPDMEKTPGLDFTTGSLGTGLAIGNGMALGARLRGLGYKVFVIMGDGEMQEGLIWEAAMAAAHYRLNNVIGIVDYNGLQIDGPVSDIIGIEPLADKWRAFGWAVKEIDGHDIKEFLTAINWADKMGQPALIVAHTVKGKGISFMENRLEWHGKACSKQERDQAMAELGVTEDEHSLAGVMAQ